MACECQNSAPGPCACCCSSAPSKDDYVELWRRVLPPSYVDAIEHEDEGIGFDATAGQAAIFACLSEAVETNVQASYLRRWSGASKPWAGGPRKAVSEVQVSRSSGDGAFLIRRGRTLLAVADDSRGQRQILARFLASDDLVMQDGEVGPMALPVEAEMPGYAGNVSAGTIVEFEPVGERTVSVKLITTNRAEFRLTDDSEFDDFSWCDGMQFALTGALVSQSKNVARETLAIISGTIIEFAPPVDAADVGKDAFALYREPSYWGVSLEHPECATGGASGSLDTIAGERGVARQGAESDQSLSRRAEELPDIISPNAILRILECELGGCGLRWRLDEAKDPNGLMGFVLDYHAMDMGSIEETGFGHGAIFSDANSKFFVVTIWAPQPRQFALAFDGGGPFPGALDAEEAPPMDGSDLDSSYQDCILRAYDSVRAATMAGVRFQFRRAAS